MKTTWMMNGVRILTRAGRKVFSILCDYKNEGGFILHTERNEPDYFCFYDVYGNKHEIVVEG